MLVKGLEDGRVLSLRKEVLFMEETMFAYQVPSAEEMKQESIKHLSITEVKDFNELLDGMKRVAADGKFMYKGMVKKEFAGSEVHHLLIALKYQVAIAPWDDYRESIVITWFK